MLLPLLKKYLITFVLLFIGYSLLNWVVQRVLQLPAPLAFLDFVLPLGIITALYFRQFRPIIRALKFSEKERFFLFMIITFSIAMAISFSQSYFVNFSYGLVTVEKPTDIYHYLRQKFFKIKSFQVKPEQASYIQSTGTDRRGTTLNISNYYITPMYDAHTEATPGSKHSSIAYALSYGTSFHNGFWERNHQQPRIDSFEAAVRVLFAQHDFRRASFFEKQMNVYLDDEFGPAIQGNPYLNHNKEVIVLLPKTSTLQQLLARDKKMFMYAVCWSLGLGFFLIAATHFLSPTALIKTPKRTGKPKQQRTTV